jgi:SAM-dependent methyltransferase
MADKGQSKPEKQVARPPWAESGADILLFPSAASAPARNHALPRGWNHSVRQGRTEPQLKAVIEALSELASGLPCRNERATFGDLVGAADLAQHPVHRWYSYKEAFSPRLPIEVIERTGTGTSGLVVDPFAGVGTTALALQHRQDVSSVVGVEYSPFAHFAGRSKLAWSNASAASLRSTATRLSRFRVSSQAEPPALAAFSNDEIFQSSDVLQLVSAREAIARDPQATPAERSILLLGLAAIIEDVSGAVKDGRALRILRGGRKRARKSLYPVRDAAIGGGARELLLNQWMAMAEDLEKLTPFRTAASKRADRHLKGDARDLEGVDRRGLRNHPLPSGAAGLCLYSPPYLNCIDYSEVYKLELWLLGFVSNQRAFREIRLGTLRSHPSVRFPERGYFDGLDDPVVEAVREIETLLEEQLPKPGLGVMARGYFEDMLRSLREQHRILEPGGYAVCVVANSTFSRRARANGDWSEAWRLPLLTDVLLARLAQVAGFEYVEIWEARDLQPRNVRAGHARESLVVARKSDSRQ